MREKLADLRRIESVLARLRDCGDARGKVLPSDIGATATLMGLTKGA